MRDFDLAFRQSDGVANIDLQNRAPTVTRTPDFREHVERRYDVLNNIPKTPAEILAACWLPLGSVDEKYTDCYLIEQRVEGQNGDSQNPCKDPPVLIRIFEQLDGFSETLIGQPAVVMDQYGNQSAIFEYWQLNVGTSTYQVPGQTVAPVPFTNCILKTEERTNDGTLRKIRRTYIDHGILSDTERLMFGGKLLMRELTYLNQVPPTPAGWTLVTQSTEFVAGLPVYRYGFANGGGGGGGAGGVISIETRYGQTITEGVTQGTTTITIKYLSDQSVSSNPITTPSGTNLIEVGYEDETGYRLWTATYAKGTGTVGLQTEAREDGSFVYDIETLSMTDGTPAYPGSGTGYNTELSHTKVGGYVVNRSKWVKPPPTVTYRRQMEWDNPGLAYFVGTDLILQPGARMQKLGFVEVSFATTQDTTQPFFVQQWGGFIETYTPTDTGIAINNQFGLNGYLTTGSSSSGTGMYKGVDCTAWSYQRFASIPSALPTGLTVIAVNNAPYLVDINGVMVFKITIESVTV